MGHPLTLKLQFKTGLGIFQQSRELFTNYGKKKIEKINLVTRALLVVGRLKQGKLGRRLLQMLQISKMLQMLQKARDCYKC